MLTIHEKYCKLCYNSYRSNTNPVMLITKVKAYVDRRNYVRQY